VAAQGPGSGQCRGIRKPKQFHKLVNDKTLLTNTLERVDHKGDGLRYLPTRIVGGIGFESLLTEQGEPAASRLNAMCSNRSFATPPQP
jgi:hypothetical protein